MPIEFQWLDDDHTVNLWTFGETFTWDEYESVRLAARVDHPNYVIVDGSRVETLPDDTLSRLPRIVGQAQDNLRFAVLVGLQPGFTQFVGQTVGSFFQRVRFADTLDEALALVEADRFSRSSMAADDPESQED